MGLARSERFELPTLGIEIRCSIQLSYERVVVAAAVAVVTKPTTIGLPIPDLMEEG
ncbi:Protoporphyrin oxidase, flavoprotein (fragment) [Bradyrhizobium sp. STM 3843]